MNYVRKDNGLWHIVKSVTDKREYITYCSNSFLKPKITKDPHEVCPKCQDRRERYELQRDARLIGIVRYIIKFMLKNKRKPTHKEIGRDNDMSSTATVNYYIHLANKRGYLNFVGKNWEPTIVGLARADIKMCPTCQGSGLAE